jgi:hypothetical protein
MTLGRLLLSNSDVRDNASKRRSWVDKRLGAFLLLRPQGVLQMATLAIGE